MPSLPRDTATSFPRFFSAIVDFRPGLGEQQQTGLELEPCISDETPPVTDRDFDLLFTVRFLNLTRHKVHEQIPTDMFPSEMPTAYPHNELVGLPGYDNPRTEGCTPSQIVTPTNVLSAAVFGFTPDAVSSLILPLTDPSPPGVRLSESGLLTTSGISPFTKVERVTTAEI